MNSIIPFEILNFAEYLLNHSKTYLTIFPLPHRIRKYYPIKCPIKTTVFIIINNSNKFGEKGCLLKKKKNRL
jgi:hypothetical protein